MSSEESKIVYKHQENLVKTFFSITDESIGMRHFRYTNDDYFSADESIKSCGETSPIVVDGIYAQWVTTENSDPNKRILYLHGGGYAIGTIRGYLSLSSHIAKATGCSVLVIDYSLAPENKFPAAVNDSKKAFNWMLENGPNGNNRCQKSFISGDSAGGGLAIGVTLALKDDNNDLPNAVIPLSPWAELDPVSESYKINERLDFLLNVGLDYLTLSRESGTLSGGEAQRIRLASQIGSGLTGVLYVLDEPSIGLHQKDNIKLIQALKRLRDLGNTVIVVEHDTETMENADHIIDLGPEGGSEGGQIIASGTPEQITKTKGSHTGKHLKKELKVNFCSFNKSSTFPRK